MTAVVGKFGLSCVCVQKRGGSQAGSREKLLREYSAKCTNLCLCVPPIAD